MTCKCSSIAFPHRRGRRGRHDVLILVASAIVGILALQPGIDRTLSQDSSSTFDRAIAQAADQVEAASRGSSGKIAVPDVQLPATPHVNQSHALEVWLRLELAHIRSLPPKDRAHAMTQLAAALRRLASTHAKSPLASVDPQTAATQILSQRAYQAGGAGPAPPPHENFVQKFLAWLGEQIGKLAQRIFGATTSNPIIGKLIAALYIIFVAALAVYLIVVVASMFVRRRRLGHTDAGTPLSVATTAQEWYAQATHAASQGHFAQAVALLFRASVAAADEKGTVPLDDSLTPGEYRRAVHRARAAASPYFDAIARAFVMAAFAERPVTQRDFVDVDAAYQQFCPLLAA